jgi:putative hydrolase of the HAD superfamily
VVQETQFKAVIFDGGGIFSMSADSSGQRYWERKLGLEPNGLRRLIGPELSRQANIGQVTDEELWERVLAPFGLDRSAREFVAADYWSGGYLDYDMVALIERAHAAGFRTALLSNAWLSARASHTALGWDRLLCFDVQLFSAEEGLMKPEGALYRRCLERLGAKATETLFIDDSLPNVEGARAMGLTALHYTDKVRDMAQIERLLGLPPAPWQQGDGSA